MCSGGTFWSRIFFIVWQSDADHYRNSNSQIDIKKNQSNKISDFPSSVKPTAVNNPKLRRSFSQKDMSLLHDGYSVSWQLLYASLWVVGNLLGYYIISHQKKLQLLLPFVLIMFCFLDVTTCFIAMLLIYALLHSY